MDRVAVTGRPGCGKTTLLRRVAERLKEHVRVGGIYTVEEREGPARKGFAAVDIQTGESRILAHVDVDSPARVGKYGVDTETIDAFVVPAIERSGQHCHLVVIDEIAPMELKSARFAEAVERLLDIDLPLLFAIHGRTRHPLLTRIRREFDVREVTVANRDRLAQSLVEAFLGQRAD